MKILFYDPLTPTPYTNLTLRLSALRGTEATVIRIAQGLKNTHLIYVAQHCRHQDELSDGVHYISFDTAQRLTPDVVILLRQPRLLDKMASCFPKARLYFWLHNLPSRRLYHYRDSLIKHKYEIITVSQFHCKITKQKLEGKWYQRIFYPKQTHPIPIHFLYNPIDELLAPDATPINPNQLIFTSAPYKGLTQTLKLFTAIREHYPEYELLIANPDGIVPSFHLPKQARFLPPLPHQELIQHIRTSFCVFYPQTERVETFGLVYAEANAVGTPVLAHDKGAAREVLSDVSQLIDAKKISTLISKLADWRVTRPLIRGKPEFQLNRVIATWLALLNR